MPSACFSLLYTRSETKNLSAPLMSPCRPTGVRPMSEIFCLEIRRTSAATNIIHCRPNIIPSSAWDRQPVLWPGEAQKVGSPENAFISTFPVSSLPLPSPSTFPPFSFIRLLFPFSSLSPPVRPWPRPWPPRPRPPSLSPPLSISAQITRAVYQSLSQQARG